MAQTNKYLQIRLDWLLMARQLLDGSQSPSDELELILINDEIEMLLEELEEIK